MLKIFLLVILILVQNPNLFCQTILKGSIQTNKNQPIVGANIYFKGTIEGTTSDEEGKFSLSTNQTEALTLVVSSLGFKTYENSFIPQQNITDLLITLVENEVELKEIVVYPGTFEAGDKNKSVVLNRIDMATNPIGFGDALSAIRTLPGTSNAGDEGGLIVRGGEQNETKTFVDGLLVESPYTAKLPGVPVRGRFSPMLFKGTIFSTGGYSAEYGQALSSVLVLNSIDMTEKDETSFSLFFPGININKVKKWKNSSLSASSQYVNMSPLYSISPSNIKWDHEPENFNQMAAYRHRIGNSGLIKIMANFSVDNSSMYYRNLDTRQTDLMALRNNDVYIVSTYKGSIGKDWVMHSGFSYNLDKVKIKLNEDNIDDTKHSYEFKLSFVRSLKENIKLKFGGNLFYKKFTRNYVSNASNSSINWKIDNPLFAAFMESEMKLFKRISLRMGGRAESIPLSNETTISPRFSLAYKTSTNSQVSLGYGVFSEQPQLDYILYNKNLQTERANHYILNYQITKNSRIFRIEAYYKKYTELVKFDSIYAIAPEAYNNNGFGYAQGLDIFYRDSKSIKNGDFWISYSLLDTKRNYKDYSFAHAPYFISKHNLSLVYKHYINNTDSYISAGYEFSSGRTYIDPNTSFYDLKKTKSYHSLSISVFHFTKIFGKFTMLFAQITNVLGSKNVFGYRYAKSPDEYGVYESMPVNPVSRRFYMVGIFVSLNGKPEL
jgi:hypothetical protein